MITFTEQILDGKFHFLCSVIEYEKTNVFHEKSYTKCGGEATPRSFYKKIKLTISLD